MGWNPSKIHFPCYYSMKNRIRLIISIAIPLVVGFTASLFTRPQIKNWYITINKPSWNPPNWLFGPMWTLLYVVMGTAFYLIWKSNLSGTQKRPAVILWVAQLLLNFFWSFIFFNQHQIKGALVDIIGLWLLILLTIFAFAKINKTAAWLLVPYISWVTFAGLLNYAIFNLNS